MSANGIRLIYFDMGNVLLHFDHHRGCRNVAALANRPELDAARVYELLFDSGLAWEYESGGIAAVEMHRRFCAAAEFELACDPFLTGISDIFHPNEEIFPLVEELHSAGRRLGVLSNTCDAHWGFVTRGLLAPLMPRFDVLALSYELRAMKPNPVIYERAAQLAGVRPEEIFFTDDRPENIAAARAAGYDAALFTSTADLRGELAERGLM